MLQNRIPSFSANPKLAEKLFLFLSYRTKYCPENRLNFLIGNS
ncbi:hypothetical protein DCF50_p164 [Dehalobacter sp. CF]|nr:hypothetical protein DCF50_p164 [Dehalobacter sp. CF]